QAIARRTIATAMAMVLTMNAPCGPGLQSVGRSQVSRLTPNSLARLGLGQATLIRDARQYEKCPSSCRTAAGLGQERRRRGRRGRQRCSEKDVSIRLYAAPSQAVDCTAAQPAAALHRSSGAAQLHEKLPGERPGVESQPPW